MRGATILPAMPPEVAAAFDAFSDPARTCLLAIRRLIFEMAERSAGVGPLTEALRWGEPAYLTEATGSGSTIRLGLSKQPAGQCAIFFNCRTVLVETFRMHFPDALAYQGNRAILLAPGGPLPEAPLTLCLAMALTYHRAHGRNP